MRPAAAAATPAAQGEASPLPRQIYAIGVPLLYFILLLLIYPELRARQLATQDASARRRGQTPKSGVLKADRLLGRNPRAGDASGPIRKRRR